MDPTIKCSKCGKDILSSEKTDHDFKCGYAFDIKDYENLIPCEICNNLFDINDYNEHISLCTSPQSIFLRHFTDQPPPSLVNINDFPFLNNLTNWQPLQFNFTLLSDNANTAAVILLIYPV